MFREVCRYQANAVPLSSPIQDLNVELVKIYDTNNVKLTLNDIYLYMKSTTVLSLFIELEQCVETFYELRQCMHDVNKKFEYFVSFLRKNCINKINCANKSDVANILYKIYDKNSIIEYELVAYALDNIVYAALMTNKCIY